MGALEAVIFSQVDVKLSSMQRTLLASIMATVQKLTLEQKAAMDEATYNNILKTGNNYSIDVNNYNNTFTNTVFDNFTTYTLTGATLGVAAKVLSPTNLAVGDNVRKDYGSAAVGDFYVEFQHAVNTTNGGNYLLSSLSDTATNNTTFIGANGGHVKMSNSSLEMTIGKIVDSVLTEGTPISISNSTTYYLTFKRIGSTYTLAVYSNSGRTSHVTGSPQSVVGNSNLVRYHTACFGLSLNGNGAMSYTGDSLFPYSIDTTANLKSAAIAKDANIGLRYWSDIVCNLVAGAAGSTVKAKILNSAGTALHTNYVTIPAAEYGRIPLERDIVLTAASAGQTVWNFTSLTNADAFINELGVLAKALLVELALDGTNYEVLDEVTDFNEDISNILAPKITLVSGTGVISGTSKLRATYIVNIPLSNTTIKLQVQLNRVATVDTSPSIQPLVGDATKYVSAGQVAIV